MKKQYFNFHNFFCNIVISLFLSVNLKTENNNEITTLLTIINVLLTSARCSVKQSVNKIIFFPWEISFWIFKMIGWLNVGQNFIFG